MNIKLLLVCLADCLLIVTPLIYGVKFLKKRNYLLGLEWLIVAVSAANFLFFLVSGVQVSYEIAYFFDTFSRGFGIPVIAIAGLMVVTHRYRPSILADSVLFGVSIVGGAIVDWAQFIQVVRPYFLLAMWSAFSIYLAYFAVRLLGVGAKRHAVGVVVALLTSQAIAMMDDFYTIPGDNAEHMSFYTLALTAWSYLCFALYHAYCALERGTTPASDAAMPGRSAVQS